jgi:hypothetical protein
MNAGNVLADLPDSGSCCQLADCLLEAQITPFLVQLG